MKKVTKSKVKQTRNNTNRISYGLRQKTVQNDSKPKRTVTKTKSTPVTNKNIRSNNIKETPNKKLKEKQLTDDSTSKTNHLDQKTPVTRNNKKINEIKVAETKLAAKNSTNVLKNNRETVLSTKIRSQRTKDFSDASTPKTRQLDKKTPVIKNRKKTNGSETVETPKTKSNSTKILKKHVIPQETNSMTNVTVLVERLSKRLLKLHADKKISNTAQNKPMENKNEPKKTALANSTPQNKIPTVETPKTKSNSTKILKKHVIPQETNSMINVTVLVERLSKRLLKLHADKKISNTAQNKPMENKNEPKKTALANSTPQNKIPSLAEEKSAQPVRVLRKRNNAIVNKYKDITLDSPLLKKPQKPASSNPMAVYDFEFDPTEEPAKKRNRRQKCESDSSGEEDISMRLLLKKLRKANKKVSVKKKKMNQNKIPEIKLVANEQKKTDQINVSPKKIANKTKQNLIEGKQIKPVILAEKEKPKQLPVNNKNNLLEIESKVPEKQNNLQKITEKSELPQISINDIEMDSLSDHSDPFDPISEVHENFVEKKQTEPEIQAEKQNPKQPVNNKNNLPQIAVSDVEMISLSDHSDPISIVDPSIQARNIVEEVTKSFMEDLTDEDSNSPGKVQILSNVMIREGKTKNIRKKIFNSTTNDLKPSKPWRIDVSAVRKKPHVFTYKDKSFTPCYEPDYDYVINENNVPPNTNDKNGANQENIKLTYQTSILNFVKGTKPKIAENKIAGLFNDLPKKVVQSPRKVLGEINYVQSTPLKHINNLNFLNLPNISIIYPEKKSGDEMFEFSYFSDDGENKENNSPRKSPKKIKQKANLVNEVVHIVNINQDKDNNNDKIVNATQEEDNVDIAVKEENLTVQEPEMPAVSIDIDLSIPLFQDIDKQLVCKKSTRKYVKKHPKRKRLLSADTVHSDDESEPESLPQKKKRKNEPTEAEEKEADRLALYYNSMFEEIEKYPLLIE